jgi:hypothetical protein
MNMRFVSLAVVVLLAAPAFGEPIGRLAAGASCRDEKGVVRQPQVRPPDRAQAQRAHNGMIKTDDPISGADCYFYRAEAVLSETPPCPSASVGQANNKIAGTLSPTPTSCTDR